MPKINSKVTCATLGSCYGSDCNWQEQSNLPNSWTKKKIFGRQHHSIPTKYGSNSMSYKAQCISNNNYDKYTEKCDLTLASASLSQSGTI